MRKVLTMLLFLGVALATSAQTTYQTPYQTQNGNNFGGSNTFFGEGDIGACQITPVDSGETLFGGTSHGTIRGLSISASLGRRPPSQTANRTAGPSLLPSIGFVTGSTTQ